MSSLYSVPTLTNSQAAICFAANARTCVAPVADIAQKLREMTGNFLNERELHLIDDLAAFASKNPIDFRQKLKAIVDAETGKNVQGRFLSGETVTGKTVLVEVLDCGDVIVSYVSNGIFDPGTSLAN